MMPIWIFMIQAANEYYLIAFLLLQIVIDYYSSFVLNPYTMPSSLWKDLLLYRLNYWVIHYFFIFLLGGYLAVRFAEFRTFMQKHFFAITSVFILSLGSLLGYYYYCLWVKKYSLLGAVNTAHQLSPAGIFYTLGATIFLFAFFDSQKCPQIMRKLFSFCGKHSYFSYLCHPIYLSIFGYFLHRYQVVLSAPVALGMYVCVASIAVLTGAFCRQFSKRYVPLLNILTIGVYPRKK